MITLKLHGRITEDGNIEVDEALNLPAGTEVQVVLEALAGEDERPWTADELNESLRAAPTSAAEILQSGVIGAWEHKNILDSQAWVDAIRYGDHEAADD